MSNFFEKFDLFSKTTLWPIDFYEALLTKIDNEVLSDYFYKLRDENKKGRVKSNRAGGWQSELLNLKDKEIMPLSNEIINVVNKIGFKEQFKIFAMWGNINSPGSYNLMHRHAHTILSGTYYVKTPKDSGQIQFRCPVEGVLLHQWWANKLNGDYYKYNPEKGMLLIWPSFVDHWVTPNNSNDDRISISFDLIATNQYVSNGLLV